MCVDSNHLCVIHILSAIYKYNSERVSTFIRHVMKANQSKGQHQIAGVGWPPITTPRHESKVASPHPPDQAFSSLFQSLISIYLPALYLSQRRGGKTEGERAAEQASLASMGSVTASRAAVSMAVSEMPLKFTCGASFRSAPSRPATFKILALFSKKKAAPPPKSKTVSPADEELAKWYGTY